MARNVHTTTTTKERWCNDGCVLPLHYTLTAHTQEEDNDNIKVKYTLPAGSCTVSVTAFIPLNSKDCNFAACDIINTLQFINIRYYITCRCVCVDNK